MVNSVLKRKNIPLNDENNECNEGDKVLITETRPLSKNKRWRLIIERAVMLQTESRLKVADNTGAKRSTSNQSSRWN